MFSAQFLFVAWLLALLNYVYGPSCFAYHLPQLIHAFGEGLTTLSCHSKGTSIMRRYHRNSLQPIWHQLLFHLPCAQRYVLHRSQLFGTVWTTRGENYGQILFRILWPEIIRPKYRGRWSDVYLHAGSREHHIRWNAVWDISIIWLIYHSRKLQIIWLFVWAGYWRGKMDFYFPWSRI